MRQLEGIQKRVVIVTTVTKIAKFRKEIKEKSSKILTDDVVAKESQNSVDVDLFDDIPESLDYVLNGLLTNAFVAEALNAGSSIRQNVWRLNSEARLVD